MTRFEQMCIAQSIFDKVKPRFTNIILAGGAPRDWYLERECKDLDFYISSDMLEDKFKEQLESLLGPIVRKGKTQAEKDAFLLDVPDTDEDYSDMVCLRAVFETTINEMKVQFMLVDGDMDGYSIVDQFGVTLTKCFVAWVTPHLALPLQSTDSFKISHELKVCGVRTALHKTESGYKYIKKIKEKFPDYLYGTSVYEMAGKRMVAEYCLAKDYKVSKCELEEGNKL